MIVRTRRIDGHQRYSWIKNQRSWSVSRTRPCSLRFKTINCCRSHRVLSFKPQHRPEWRGQDGQNETEQPDHSTSLGDSITSSTRIRFSVHRVFYAHPPDQPAKLRLDLWPPSPSTRFPTPVAAKASPVPTHERLGPDDCESEQD